MTQKSLVQHVQEGLRSRLDSSASPVNLRVLASVIVLIGALSAIAARLDTFSILYFPPLAAASYRLFRTADRQPRIPWKFPAAFTYGACSGWVALAVTRVLLL